MKITEKEKSTKILQLNWILHSPIYPVTNISNKDQLVFFNIIKKSIFPTMASVTLLYIIRQWK